MKFLSKLFFPEDARRKQGEAFFLNPVAGGRNSKTI